MDDIYDRFHHLLDSLDLVWLDPEAFAEAVHEKGAPLTECWGFIDGTPRPIARRFVQPNGEPYVIYGDPAYGSIPSSTPYR